MNCQNENRFLTLEQIFITTNTCTGMYPSITGVKICVSNKNSIEMQRNCQNVVLLGNFVKRSQISIIHLVGFVNSC
jgi:hypothetical protein